jgi:hypothetical protein
MATISRILLGAAVCGVLCSGTVSAEAIQPAATVPGPVAGTVMTPGYAEAVGQLAYAWGWPLVNMHNRRAMYSQVPQIALLGPTPVAPLNELAMLNDYIDPNVKIVAHPNQDVVYGFGALALDKEPVVIQVPDFGDRFWLYQVADQRTDSFARLGTVHGTKPGFYLLVGPNWQGETPKGISGVFRSPTHTGVVIPRAFMADTATDRAAIQPVLSEVMMYPLSRFDGTMQRTDWSKLPALPLPNTQGDSKGELSWVTPKRFFSDLNAVLAEVPPLPGEEALYGQFKALIAAGEQDPAIARVLAEVAERAEQQIVDPLFLLNNNGVRLAHGWTRPLNNAKWGTDYLTRLAVAKSNIFENGVDETSYIFAEHDGAGQRLSGAHQYSLTFAKGQTPPVTGFWSLTMYDKYHFFATNALKRYSTGTKNKSLKYHTDGSLTLYVQHEQPSADKLNNWLPAPAGEFAMTLRAYGPKPELVNASWAPPAIVRATK